MIKKITLLILFILVGGTGINPEILDAFQLTSPNNSSKLLHAYQNNLSDVQVKGEGIVSVILPDDLKGSRHQRLIVRLDEGFTVLIAHNIDLANKIENIKKGDRLAFYGEYEWNNKGGVVHWTHHDPDNRHEHGWLKHQGQIYQ